MPWKHIDVHVKVMLSFGYETTGYRVSKSDIEPYLYEHLVDLIEDGAFKPMIESIQSSYDAPTTVSIDLV